MRRRWVGYAGLGLIVAATIIADYLVLTSRAMVTRFVRRELEHSLGGTVSFNSAGLDLDGILRLEKISVLVPETDLVLFTSDAIELRFIPGTSFGRLERVTLVRPDIRFSEDLLRALSERPPERPLHEQVSSDLLPRVEVQGGMIEAKYDPILRPPMPHGFRIRSLMLSPIGGYVYALRGKVAHDVLGEWTASGDYNVDTGAMKLVFSTDSILFGERVRGLLSDDVQTRWDRWKPEGRGGAYVRIEGEPGVPLMFRASLSFSDVAVTYSGFPYRVSGISGGGEFTEQGFEIGELRSSMEGIDLRVSARADGYDDQAALRVGIQVKNLPLDDRLRDALPEKIRERWEEFSPAGQADVEWSVYREREGTLQDGGRIRFGGDARAVYHKVPIPLTAIHGAVEISSGSVHLDHLRARVAGAAVELEGRHQEGTGLELSIDARGLDLNPDVVSALPGQVRKAVEGLGMAGKAHVQLHLKTDDRTDETNYELDLRLSDAEMNVSVPLKQIEGSVLMTGVFSEKNSWSLGHLNFGRLVMEGKTLTDILGTFHLQGSSVVFSRIQAGMYGGLLKGVFALDTATGDYRGEFLGDRLDLAEFARETDLLRRKAVVGKVSFDLRELTGNAANRATLVGRGTIQIREGYLWDIPVFVSLWTVNPQNVFKAQNQFEAGTIRYKIGGEKFVLRSLAFTSEDASVVGYGSIGFDGTLDLALRTVGGSLLGVKIPGLDYVLSAFDWLKGKFLGVHVTGTLEKPENSVEFLPGLGEE